MFAVAAAAGITSNRSQRSRPGTVRKLRRELSDDDAGRAAQKGAVKVPVYLENLAEPPRIQQGGHIYPLRYNEQMLGPAIPLTVEVVDDWSALNAGLYGLPWKQSASLDEAVEQHNRILEALNSMPSSWRDAVGSVPWKPGDALPEDVIRQGRD